MSCYSSIHELFSIHIWLVSLDGRQGLCYPFLNTHQEATKMSVEPRLTFSLIEPYRRASRVEASPDKSPASSSPSGRRRARHSTAAAPTSSLWRRARSLCLALPLVRQKVGARCQTLRANFWYNSRRWGERVTVRPDIDL